MPRHTSLLLVIYLLPIGDCPGPRAQTVILQYDFLSKDPTAPTGCSPGKNFRLDVPVRSNPVYLAFAMSSYSGRFVATDASKTNRVTASIPFVQTSIRVKYAPSDVYAYDSAVLVPSVAFQNTYLPAANCIWIVKINATAEINNAAATVSGDKCTVAFSASFRALNENVDQYVCANAKTDADTLLF